MLRDRFTFFIFHQQIGCIPVSFGPTGFFVSKIGVIMFVHTYFFKNIHRVFPVCLFLILFLFIACPSVTNNVVNLGDLQIKSVKETTKEAGNFRRSKVREVGLVTCTISFRKRKAVFFPSHSLYICKS